MGAIVIQDSLNNTDIPLDTVLNKSSLNNSGSITYAVTFGNERATHYTYSSLARNTKLGLVVSSIMLASFSCSTERQSIIVD